jgi:phosphohistidine phosphatase SixA
MAIRRRVLVLTAVWASLASAMFAGCSEGCGVGGDDTGAEPPATTVYVVRHAEKGEGPDPELSASGRRRALALPAALELDSLRAIYSTATRRTRQTAAPVAAVTGLAVTRMPPTDYSGLLERVQSHAGEAVLVVGHSNTVPAMLAALGVEEPLSLDDEAYGDLFVVTVPAQGPATVEKRRFGDHEAARTPETPALGPG